MDLYQTYIDVYRYHPDLFELNTSKIEDEYAYLNILVDKIVQMNHNYKLYNKLLDNHDNYTESFLTFLDKLSSQPKHLQLSKQVLNSLDQQCIDIIEYNPLIKIVQVYTQLNLHFMYNMQISNIKLGSTAVTHIYRKDTSPWKSIKFILYGIALYITNHVYDSEACIRLINDTICNSFIKPIIFLILLYLCWNMEVFIATRSINIIKEICLHFVTFFDSVFYELQRLMVSEFVTSISFMRLIISIILNLIPNITKILLKWLDNGDESSIELIGKIVDNLNIAKVIKRAMRKFIRERIYHSSIRRASITLTETSVDLISKPIQTVGLTSIAGLAMSTAKGEALQYISTLASEGLGTMTSLLCGNALESSKHASNLFIHTLTPFITNKESIQQSTEIIGNGLYNLIIGVKDVLLNVPKMTITSQSTTEILFLGKEIDKTISIAATMITDINMNWISILCMSIITMTIIFLLSSKRSSSSN